MDIQKMLDGLGRAMQMQRQSYHLTLGQLIAFLKECEGTLPINFDEGGAPGMCYSYRGYYEDLAFFNSGHMVTVSDFLPRVLNANGKTFEGYKGGLYLMDDNTCLWRAEYGVASGVAIVGISKTDSAVTLQTKQVDQ